LTLLRAGVPERYAEAVWRKAKAQAALLEYTNNVLKHVADGAGLLILGPVGTGKSSSAGLVCREAIKQGLSVHWDYVPDLIAELNDRTKADHVFRRAVVADIEVWDDFGVGGLQDWQIGLLDRIVERRYSRSKPMIVTTNLSKTTLTQTDELQRMVDRWLERNFVVTVSGMSMRKTWREEQR